MKAVLVTGGAGFIGSHVCEHFLGSGWKVTDRFWQCMDMLRDLRLLDGQWEQGKTPWKTWQSIECAY